MEEKDEDVAESECSATSLTRNCDVEQVRRAVGGVIQSELAARPRVVVA
jgi:hypothetical protein